MSKSENILAFEAALKENKELFEKFTAAKKRIAENKEAASDGELLVKAAAATSRYAISRYGCISSSVMEYTGKVI